MALLLLAGCELGLGFGDKTFCDDTPEGCGETTTANGGAGGAGLSGGAPNCDWPAPMMWNEEFDMGALSTWQTLDNLDNDVSEPMGTLFIEPDADDFWWDSERAPFVYRTVCGDFGLFVQVDAKHTINSTLLQGDYNGAGILARNPNPATAQISEHWLFLSHGDEGEEYGAEAFWARPDHGSDYLGGGIPDSMPVIGAQLVLCRIGTTWYSYVMPDCTQTSQEVVIADNADLQLPEVVQLGVTANRMAGSEPVEGGFRWANLFRPTNAADCEAVLDPNYVPDYACP